MNMNKFSWKDLVRAPADEGTPAPADTAVPAGGGDPAPAEPQAAHAAEGPDLSFIPQDYYADGKPDVAKFSAHYAALVSEQAQRAEAMQDVPEAPNGYEFGVPEDLDLSAFEGLPEGYSVDLAVDDPTVAPLFEELGNVLHQFQMPKQAAGALMGVLAKYTAAQDAKLMSDMQADLATLGQGAASRVSHVKHLLEARLPGDMAKALMGATQSAAGVKALEKLLAPRAMQSPAAQPKGNNLLDDNLSPFDRLKAARTAT